MINFNTCRLTNERFTFNRDADELRELRLCSGPHSKYRNAERELTARVGARAGNVNASEMQIAFAPALMCFPSLCRLSRRSVRVLPVMINSYNSNAGGGATTSIKTKALDAKNY